MKKAIYGLCLLVTVHAAAQLENQKGTTRIWILNNAAFPVLLKTEGNTLGPI